jgi:hypothetical protein
MVGQMARLPRPSARPESILPLGLGGCQLVASGRPPGRLARPPGPRGLAFNGNPARGRATGMPVAIRKQRARMRVSSLARDGNLSAARQGTEHTEEAPSQARNRPAGTGNRDLGWCFGIISRGDSDKKPGGWLPESLAHAALASVGTLARLFRELGSLGPAAGEYSAATLNKGALCSESQLERQFLLVRIELPWQTARDSAGLGGASRLPAREVRLPCGHWQPARATEMSTVTMGPGGVEAHRGPSPADLSNIRESECAGQVKESALTWRLSKARLV